LVFLVKSYEDALDFAPDLSPMARRLARKCWPGPLTILVPGPHPDSVISRLPDEVQRLCTIDGRIGMRVPADPMAMEVLRINAGPVLTCNSGSTEFEPAGTATELLQTLSDQIDILIDGGQCRFSRPSTVVEIMGEEVHVVRRGVIDERALKRMSDVNILIVCTGNTCRSPMAEGLLKARLAKSLGCDPNGLSDAGFHVESAGIEAMPGGGVSAEAVEALKPFHVDISCHSSQPVTERLVQNADLILTMTNAHRMALLARWPMAAGRTFLLGHDTDISDPIGMPLEYYSVCADQIDKHLESWLKDHAVFKSIPNQPWEPNP
jgi:protein-tyrosine phosphatase